VANLPPSSSNPCSLFLDFETASSVLFFRFARAPHSRAFASCFFRFALSARIPGHAGCVLSSPRGLRRRRAPAARKIRPFATARMRFFGHPTPPYCVYPSLSRGYCSAHVASGRFAEHLRVAFSFPSPSFTSFIFSRSISPRTSLLRGLPWKGLLRPQSPFKRISFRSHFRVFAFSSRDSLPGRSRVKI